MPVSCNGRRWQRIQHPCGAAGEERVMGTFKAPTTCPCSPPHPTRNRPSCCARSWSTPTTLVYCSVTQRTAPSELGFEEARGGVQHEVVLKPTRSATHMTGGSCRLETKARASDSTSSLRTALLHMCRSTFVGLFSADQGKPRNGQLEVAKHERIQTRRTLDPFRGLSNIRVPDGFVLYSLAH